MAFIFDGIKFSSGSYLNGGCPLRLVIEISPNRTLIIPTSSSPESSSEYSPLHLPSLSDHSSSESLCLKSPSPITVPQSLNLEYSNACVPVESLALPAPLVSPSPLPPSEPSPVPLSISSSVYTSESSFVPSSSTLPSSAQLSRHSTLPLPIVAPPSVSSPSPVSSSLISEYANLDTVESLVTPPPLASPLPLPSSIRSSALLPSPLQILSSAQSSTHSNVPLPVIVPPSEPIPGPSSAPSVFSPKSSVKSSFKPAKSKSARSRKSTCPATITPVRKVDDDSDSNIDLWSDESTIGEEDDFTDDDEVEKGRKKSVPGDQLTVRKKTRRSTKAAKLQKIIDEDLLLQLRVKVHVRKLPDFMDTSESVSFLEQLCSMFDRNIDRGDDLVRCYEPPPYQDDFDDDEFPSFNYSSAPKFTNTRKRPVLESDLEDDDDIEKEAENEKTPPVEKKRARMSMSKPRKRVIMHDSDSDDDSFIEDDGYEITLDSGDEDEDDQLDEDQEAQLENMAEEDKIIFWKRRQKRKYAKRKRCAAMITLSSDDEQIEAMEVNEEVVEVVKPDETISSQKSERKEIRRVITEAELEKATKEATSKERKRMERIHEMTKEYEKILPNLERGSKDKRLILDIDVESKRVRIEVNRELVKELKPHQFEGIKFMYNSVIENVDKLTDEGSGCILAHCMGLGKTLQVIAFVHTLLSNECTKKHIHTITVAVPVNTLKNWAEEFDKWLTKKGLRTDVDIYEMVDEQDNKKRAHLLDKWKRGGGVLIIGLPTFSSLMGLRNPLKRKSTNPQVISLIEEALSDPGPNLMIIDEGHLLKNAGTQLCKAVQKVRTRRKIMLTGTPLQNNLAEYHTMVNIIKPRLLGSVKEFNNRFRNPIENGQKADSNTRDVSLMKKSALVLNKLLDGCIQRFTYDTLKPFLQPKLEYALFIRPSTVMAQLYNYYVDRAHDRGRILSDSLVLRLCTNHPALYYMHEETIAKENLAKANSKAKKNMPIVGDLRPIGRPNSVANQSNQNNPPKSAIDQPTSSQQANCNDLDKSVIPFKKSTSIELNVKGDEPKTADDVEKAHDETENVETEEPEKAPALEKGWFKQFVRPDDWKNLELSGKFVMLFKILKQCVAIGEKLLVVSQSLETLDLIEKCLQFQFQTEIEINNERVKLNWERNKHYFRIDGQTSAQERRDRIRAFNNPKHSDSRLFLLSTKAGGVGINLIGANRCIIFDCSWNPSDDTQAIFRIYRLGQNKPVYVYRFVAKDSMEEKIFRKQVVKLGMAIRVLDKQQVKRNFKTAELEEFYLTRPQMHYDVPTLNVPGDKLLADLFLANNKEIVDYTVFDSLLEKKPEEDLSEEERQAAWADYQKERDAEIQAAEERKRKMEEEKLKHELELKRALLVEEAKLKLEQEKAKLAAASAAVAAAVAAAAAAIETATSKSDVTVPVTTVSTTSTISSTTTTTNVSTAPPEAVSGKNTELTADLRYLKQRLTPSNASWLTDSNPRKDSAKDVGPSSSVFNPHNANKPNQPTPSTSSAVLAGGISRSQLPPMPANLNLSKGRVGFALKNISSRPRPVVPNTSSARSRQSKSTTRTREPSEEQLRIDAEATASAINRACNNKRSYSFEQGQSSQSTSSRQSNNDRRSSEDNSRRAPVNPTYPPRHHHSYDNFHTDHSYPGQLTPRLIHQGPYSNLNPPQHGYSHSQASLQVRNPGYQPPPPQAHSGMISNQIPAAHYERSESATLCNNRNLSYNHSSSLPSQPPQPSQLPPPPPYTLPHYHVSSPYYSNPSNVHPTEHLPSTPRQRSHSNGNQYMPPAYDPNSGEPPCSPSVNVVEEISDSDEAFLSKISDLSLTRCTLSDLVEKLLSLDKSLSFENSSGIAAYITKSVSRIQSILKGKKDKLDEKARTTLLSETEIIEKITCEQSLDNLKNRIDESTPPQ